MVKYSKSNRVWRRIEESKVISINMNVDNKNL